MSADKDAGTGGAERGQRPEPYLLRTTGPDQVWPGGGRDDRPAGHDAPPGDAGAGGGTAGGTPGDAAGDADEVVEAEVVDEQAGEDRDDTSEDGPGGQGGASDELASCLAQRDEYLDSLRRLQAEFENYKKRVIKQQADQMARAAVSLLEKILPVLDTLDLAIEHMGDPGSVDGRALEAVSSQLRDVLAKEGLERISPIGEHFDPTAHEAVGHLPAETDDSAGSAESAGSAGASEAAETDAADGGGAPSPGQGAKSGIGSEPVVAEVMRAGYRWRGSVVRPAMVMVRG